MATQPMTDPYATLGVARGATTAQVSAAYRRLAKRFHPDLHPDSTAAEQMRRVNQAWEILSDPSRRAAYDAGGASRAGAGADAWTGHWGAGQRRAGSSASAASSAPGWTAAGAPYREASGYGAPDYGGRPGYGTADSYADMRPDDGPSPLRFGMLFLIVPAFALSAAILGAGFLPFPLIGLLLIFIVSTLAGRDRA
jgi:curved DNA-binding protein CbpA